MRTYESGAVSGDSGCTVTVEWRQAIGNLAGGHLQVQGFFDLAHIRINHSPWAAVAVVRQRRGGVAYRLGAGAGR